MMETVMNCFRPLSGSKVSEQVFQISYIASLVVSVPSRGARYLNESVMVYNDSVLFTFPSPLGEQGI